MNNKLRSQRITSIVTLCLLSLASLALAEETEWTRFRGPNGSGISDAKSIPTTWTDDDYNWVAKLPGKGSSSPVVWKDQIFLTSADEKTATRTVLCLNTQDGKIRWKRDFPSTTYRMHRDNDFASTTPTVDGNGVVVVWSTPKQLLMLALDLDGKEMWRKDLGPFVGLHGSASSPVIVDDMVILANDQMHPAVMARYLPKGASKVPGKSFLIAVDRKTGETRWKVKRRTVLAGYATPCVRRSENGESEVIFTGSAHGMSGIDLATGKINWEIGNILKTRTVSSPQLHGNLIYASHGVGATGQSFVAVRAERNAKEVKPTVAYDVTQSVPLVPTCVVKDDLLFLWSDAGIVTCLDAATGKRHWRERIGGAYYCSPVWIDGRLYCASKEGEMVILAADKSYKLLAKVPLGERCFSVPAVAGNVMYLRTQTRLLSLGGKE